MGAGSVVANANPKEVTRHQIEAGGPHGFVHAVYDTLRDLGRPYYYAGKVPEWLGSTKTDFEEDAFEFAEEYTRFREANTKERSFREVPHCIIHQWRRYPARMRHAGTSDSPGGSRRQKAPNQQVFHDRPLPSGAEDIAAEEKRNKQLGKAKKRSIHSRPAMRGGFKTPPLWENKEQIPDLIRDLVDEDTKMVVTPWAYDVFVDFVIVAGTIRLVNQIERDLYTILRTFHHAWTTGATNIAGFDHGSVPGAPSTIHGEIPDHMPTRTITWRLKQTEADAFPAKQLQSIRMKLYGDTFITVK